MSESELERLKSIRANPCGAKAFEQAFDDAIAEIEQLEKRRRLGTDALVAAHVELRRLRAIVEAEPVGYVPSGTFHFFQHGERHDATMFSHELEDEECVPLYARPPKGDIEEPAPVEDDQTPDP